MSRLYQRFGEVAREDEPRIPQVRLRSMRDCPAWTSGTIYAYTYPGVPITHMIASNITPRLLTSVEDSHSLFKTSYTHLAAKSRARLSCREDWLYVMPWIASSMPSLAHRRTISLEVRHTEGAVSA